MPANDRLFDTLDTTTRQARTHDGCRYILSDTVGFIRRLPHELIAGFLATLRDAVDSDVLIIVSDHTRPDWRDRLSLTQRQLADIGAGDKKCIIVQNKIDRLGIPPKVDCSDCGRMRTVFLSCRTRDERFPFGGSFVGEPALVISSLRLIMGLIFSNQPPDLDGIIRQWVERLFGKGTAPFFRQRRWRR